MPDIRGVEYLLDMMSPEGVGWFRSDGMGAAFPLDWSEINAFSDAAGLALDPWERCQIRAMSVAYVEGRRLGGEAMKVSPAYVDRPDEDPGIALERRRVSDTLGAALNALAGSAE
ncbi:MAG: hypothetical protein MJH10_15880 [Epibacterium sp.]|nr:hypothetical protein [Epibacterium sp.]NQX74996.1 hypothetical protein [Epibacterium sp.]